MNAYLTEEISLGRVAGPFDAVAFPDGFVVSPLNTLPKRDSDERSVIVDLSWPGKLAMRYLGQWWNSKRLLSRRTHFIDVSNH